MTVDADGGAIIVFQDIRTGNNNIFAYRISSDGTSLWGEDGLQLSNSNAFNASPKVVVTNGGNIIVAWQADEVTIRQKISPSGNLLWGNDGITLSGSPTYSWPQLMAVGNDSVIMKYFEDTGPVYSPTRHVYAQKYDVNGNAVWAQPALISNAAGISAWTQIFPMVNDDNDGFYIAWHDDRDNNMLSSIYVQHISSEGQVLFPANGVEASTMGNRNHFYANLAKAPVSDNIFVYWNEMDGNQNDRGIYGQKLSPSGSRLWNTNGKVFIEISSTNVYPLASRASDSDMVVIYNEYYNALDAGIKAMRIDTNGSYVWSGGKLTMSSVQSEKLHEVANDFNHDQWIAVWEDRRNTDADIYGQNIQLDGSLGSIPIIFTANFTVSDDDICAGDEVDFTDLSTGTITSWDWTFEGGSPATSNLQNPSVTYNTPGSYDVQLTISNATQTDTKLVPDMMTVKEIPGQADEPSGNSITCQGTSYEYTTEPVNYAASYNWVVTPADAGTIEGTTTTADFTPSFEYTGNFTVKVRAENECGNGSWSDELQAALYESPEIFEMSEDGDYCEGSPGAEILLYGSETGIDYVLYREGESTGDTLPGTGDTLSFAYYTLEGVYTIGGFNDNCSNQMAGQCWVSMISIPLQAAQPVGPQIVCNNQTSIYTTSGATFAETYIWLLDPAGAGTIDGNSPEVNIVWDTAFSGLADLSVTGVNDCGEGLPSDDLEINIYDAPDPEISGSTQVCRNDQEFYETVYHNGSSYYWGIDGGEIIDGAGTHLVTILWTTVGNGYVHVVEVNENNCADTTENLQVLVEECTGITDLIPYKINLSPNPVKNELVINYEPESAGEVFILMFDLTGSLVKSDRYTLKGGKNTLTIKTDILVPGLYIIHLKRNNELILVDKIHKME